LYLQWRKANKARTSFHYQNLLTRSQNTVLQFRYGLQGVEVVVRLRLSLQSNLILASKGDYVPLDNTLYSDTYEEQAGIPNIF